MAFIIRTLNTGVLCHYDECRYAERHNADCHYTECRYAECGGTNLTEAHYCQHPCTIYFI
jgi:hypothetical protein